MIHPFFTWLCTKHKLIFTHCHRFASSAQRFDKDRLRLFIKASLPARGVTISGDDRRFACTFAAPTAATSVSAAGPRAGSTRGRVLFYFFQSLFSTQPFSFGERSSGSMRSWQVKLSPGGSSRNPVPVTPLARRFAASGRAISGSTATDAGSGGK